MKRNIRIGFLIGIICGIVGKTFADYYFRDRIAENDDFKF